MKTLYRIIDGQRTAWKTTPETGKERQKHVEPASKTRQTRVWPFWAKAVATLKSPADTGVGDTIHRLAGQPGEVFKAVVKAAGVPCGCDKRQDKYNQDYPYRSGE